MVGDSNQNVFFIQIDTSSFEEFDISEFEISRVDCVCTLLKTHQSVGFFKVHIRQFVFCVVMKSRLFHLRIFGSTPTICFASKRLSHNILFPICTKWDFDFRNFICKRYYLSWPLRVCYNIALLFVLLITRRYVSWFSECTKQIIPWAEMSSLEFIKNIHFQYDNPWLLKASSRLC